MSIVLLEKLNVGQIANTYFRAILNIGKVSIIEIDKFKTECGVTSTFGLALPILSKTRKDCKGYDRYYAKKIYSYGGEYYLNAQWGPQHKNALIDRILNWMNDNRILV